MAYSFKKLQSDQSLFFNILPDDWKEQIVTFWHNYKESSNIYIIEENHQIIGGGIVFSICPPDIDYYQLEAKQWFDKDYLYLGFIWIAEDKRNMNLGSFWLDELKKLHPNQKYWLLIEEEHLHRFYQKNGFILNKTVDHRDSTEWLYVFKPL